MSLSFAWPSSVRAGASLTFDVDAESAVLAVSPAARHRMSVMSHQAYGPTVGVPRLLQLLARHELLATFFVPGFTAHRYPDVIRLIADQGHEIAHHGYMHETVVGLTEAMEGDILDRGCDALEQVIGSRPVGYRAPMWELNYRTPRLLADRGLLYDSSLMDDDKPYVLSVGRENSASIVEIPIHWGLDDWGQYCYLPELTGSGQIQSPDRVTHMWWLELQGLYDEAGCFVLVNHPFLSGRPARAAALDRLIEQMKSLEGLWIAPLRELASYTDGLGMQPRVLTQPEIPRQFLAEE